MNVPSHKIQKEHPAAADELPFQMPLMQTMQVCVEIWGEACNFTISRLDANVRTQRKILDSGSLDEIQVVQWRHVEKMMDDYHDEVGRMIKYCQGLPETAQFPPGASGNQTAGHRAAGDSGKRPGGQAG
ncbi:hypothetical protein [Leisingera sp.]|uniref:hypothetical protein n=1 Tax=Leisingera sp. TaxID=1879318 RepID=UPI002B26A444|nr:hypothetical protein [Leisingera sp.]